MRPVWVLGLEPFGLRDEKKSVKGLLGLGFRVQG